MKEEKNVSLIIAYVGMVAMLIAIYALLSWRGGLFVIGLVVFIVGAISYSEYKKEEMEEPIKSLLYKKEENERR